MFKIFKQAKALARLDAVDRIPVIRTDYSNDAAWIAIKRAVKQPTKPDGFVANVAFVDDAALDRVSLGGLRRALLRSRHPVAFAADTRTMTDPERPLVCISVRENAQAFLALPDQVVWIESNLSIGNMEFEEFSGAVDPDGVFRGFDEQP